MDTLIPEQVRELPFSNQNLTTMPRTKHLTDLKLTSLSTKKVRGTRWMIWTTSDGGRGKYRMDDNESYAEGFARIKRDCVAAAHRYRRLEEEARRVTLVSNKQTQ